MSNPRAINDRIAPYAAAATEAGMTIHVPQSNWDRRPAGHVYVTAEGKPGIALIQIPSLAFDPIIVDVPVAPNRTYGSGVLQDHDGTVEDVVRLLRELMEAETVQVRFIPNPPRVRVDHRIPSDAIIWER